MPLNLPEGIKCVANLGIDFDAISIWIGSFGLTSPHYMHRGEFGARVGAPRLLKLLAKYNIKTTWAIPGHTVETFPEIVKQIAKEGHEIAHHGYIHENPTKIPRIQEAEFIEMGIKDIKNAVGKKPRGYRAPYWDFSEDTVELLEQYGFEWDSTLMADDFRPYYLRKGDGPALTHKPYHFGEPTKILEIPASWDLDDFPFQEYLGNAMPWVKQDTETIYRRWTDIFDYMYANVPGGCYQLTNHPQAIGRAHMITMLENVIKHINSKEGVMWATLSQIKDMWRDE